eukprot:SM000053S17379  [mRNA]  locus=s53:55947:59955:+ [translate_table: standard]
MAAALGKIFHDGDDEVEVVLALPTGPPAVRAADVDVDTTATSLQVRLRGEPLLDAGPLYEAVRPGRTTWYLDDGGRSLVVTLQKAAPARRWPALTDREALDLRFPPSPPAQAPPAKAGGDIDGGAAVAERAKVDSLLRAAQDGSLQAFKDAVQALCSEGDDVVETMIGVKDANGRTALHFAAGQGRMEILEHLLDELRTPADIPDAEGDTPLIHAARNGHVAAVKALLEHQAAASTSNPNSGASAIHHAAGCGSRELVELLLDRGVDVNACSDAGSPLLWACGNGHDDVAVGLLDRSADCNVVNSDSVSALLISAAAGHTALVKLLLSHGANPGVRATGRVTPLHVAAEQGNIDIVNALLDAGADPNALDDEGAMPLTAATAQGCSEVVHRLLPLTSQKCLPPVLSSDALVEGAQHPAFQQRSTLDGDEKNVDVGADSPATSHPLTLKKAGLALEAKQRADEEFKRRNFQTALDAYTQAGLLAIELDPENATLYSNRSLCWMRLDQAEQALADAQDAKRLRPDWSKAAYRLGRALRHLLRHEEAANAFFEGVQLDPENVEMAQCFREAVEAGRAAHAFHEEASQAVP